MGILQRFKQFDAALDRTFSGQAKMEPLLKRFEVALARAAKEGREEIMLSFGPRDLGQWNNATQATNYLVNRLQAAGHTVLAVNDTGPDARMLRCRPAVSDGDEMPDADDGTFAPLIPAAGDAGKEMSPSQVEERAALYKAMFARGAFRAVWDDRVELGFGVSSDEVATESWFWLNALPAIAACRLGSRSHPIAAMCAGFADSASDASVTAQRDAIAEIRHAWHPREGEDPPVPFVPAPG